MDANPLKKWFQSQSQLEKELIEKWYSFERLMRQQIGDADSSLTLRAVIDQFATASDIDPEHINRVLRIRNAIAHGTQRVDRTDLHDAVSFVCSYINDDP